MHCILPQKIPNSKANKGIISRPPNKKLQNHIAHVWTSKENNICCWYKFCRRKISGFMQIADDPSYYHHNTMNKVMERWKHA